MMFVKGKDEALLKSIVDVMKESAEETEEQRKKAAEYLEKTTYAGMRLEEGYGEMTQKAPLHMKVAAAAKMKEQEAKKTQQSTKDMKKEEVDFDFNDLLEYMLTPDFEQLDEISKETLKSYIPKAARSLGAAHDRETYGKAGYGVLSQVDTKTISKRTKGLTNAVKKMTKEEFDQLDEISKGTLGSYIKKATSSSDERSISNLSSRAADKLNNPVGDDSGEKDDHKSYLRSKGIARAVNRLTKEEVEIEESVEITKIHKEFEAIVEKLQQESLDQLTEEDLDLLESLNDESLEAINELSSDHVLAYARAAGKDAGKSLVHGKLGRLVKRIKGLKKAANIYGKKSNEHGQFTSKYGSSRDTRVDNVSQLAGYTKFRKEEAEQVEESIEDRLEAAREKAAAKGKIKEKEPMQKSNVRQVAGKAYGGSKQKEKEEVDESVGSVPKTEREKKLAAMSGDPSKITKGDVLKARGVKMEEVELDEISHALMGRYVGALQRRDSDVQRDKTKSQDEKIRSQLDTDKKLTKTWSKMQAAYQKQRNSPEGIAQRQAKAAAAKAGQKSFNDLIKSLQKTRNESVELEEASIHPMGVHVIRHPGGKMQVHAVGKNVEGIEIGEHLRDSDLDDLADMGHKIKEVKPPKKMAEAYEVEFNDGTSQIIDADIVEHVDMIVAELSEETQAEVVDYINQSHDNFMAVYKMVS